MVNPNSALTEGKKIACKVAYCSSLDGGERSHERIWLLVLSCWFSSQDGGRVFLLGALTFTLDYFFLFRSFFSEQF